MSYRAKGRSFETQETERDKENVSCREKWGERVSELRGLRESEHPRKRRGWEKAQACPMERVTLGPCTKGFYLETSGNNFNRTFISCIAVST